MPNCFQRCKSLINEYENHESSSFKQTENLETRNNTEREPINLSDGDDVSSEFMPKTEIVSSIFAENKLNKSFELKSKQPKKVFS